MQHPIPVAHLESEEEYFRKLDAELIEEARKRAAAEEEHRRIAEILHTENPEILAAVEKLGFTHTTIILLELVPLVELAWSDGIISPMERERLLLLAGERGVEADTPAYEQLTAWLEQSPSAEFFEGTWGAIEAVCESLPEGERQIRKDALIRTCHEFAVATCLHFGWASHIGAAKRKLLHEFDLHLAAASLKG